MPKTIGYQWLEYSFAAFNGTRYPDRTSPENMVDSYIAYKQKKRQSQAIELAYEHYDRLCLVALKLLSK